MLIKYERKGMVVIDNKARNNKGFTLAELLIVVAIISVLVAVSIPIFQKQLENSREKTDLANVRAAYAEVMTAVLARDTSNMTKTVELTQTQDDWQSVDPVEIAGITHYKSQGDTENWKGIPKAKGQCQISYNYATGILFNWGNGTSDIVPTPPGPDLSLSLHAPLNSTDILSDLKNKNNAYFEIDSTCPNSTMLPKVQAELEKGGNSLMKYGSWAYQGSPKNDNERYLFWTSVDTNTVGAGNTIPIIISRADGSFFVSTSTTAQRVNNNKTYITITDHLTISKIKEKYTNGKEKYKSLEEAYAVYEKSVKDNYPEHVKTLPK